jgi:serine/threonine protein phosphatase PrpC
MIARSFGDHYSDLEGLNEHLSPNGKKLISYQPDIYQHDIAAILAKNDGSKAFLMTSSDGMYENFGMTKGEYKWLERIGNEATYAKALEDWFINKNEVQEKWENNVAEYLRDYAIDLGSHDNVTVCFSDITQAPTKPLVVGVFDAHSGNVTSSIVARALGEDLLEKGAVIQYAGEPKSIKEFVQSLRTKTEIDKNNNMDFYPKSNPLIRTKNFPNTKISPTSSSTIANSSEKCNEA